MTTVIVCPFYFCFDKDRADVTRRVFKHYALIPDTIFVGGGSEGDLSREIFNEAHDDANYVEFFQDWEPDSVGAGGSAGLRRKLNATIAAARKYDPDYVYIVGSDDMMPPGFFVPAGGDLICTGQGPDAGAYFWQYGNRDFGYWWDGVSVTHPQTRIAVGCMGFSRPLLEAMDFCPYNAAGDEYAAEAWVLDHPEFRFEFKRQPGWHPKTDKVLNDLPFMRKVFGEKLQQERGPEFDAFITYWDALGAEDAATHLR